MMAHAPHAADTMRATVAAAVGSAATVWGVLDPTDTAAVLVGAAGALSLVGLMLKLLADHRHEAQLRDGYIELVGELQAERDRLRAVVDDLRSEINDLNAARIGLLEQLAARPPQEDGA